MQSFPLFFRTTGARVTIVGGGEQAAQKARLILKTDAEITLVADRLDPELAALVQTGRATHQTELSTEVFDAAFAFIATGCPGLDAAAHGLAKAARCPVNVVDRPSLCDVTTPAIVDRAPIVVGIGGGTGRQREFLTCAEAFPEPSSWRHFPPDFDFSDIYR